MSKEICFKNSSSKIVIFNTKAMGTGEKLDRLYMKKRNKNLIKKNLLPSFYYQILKNDIVMLSLLKSAATQTAAKVSHPSTPEWAIQ